MFNIYLPTTNVDFNSIKVRLEPIGEYGTSSYRPHISIP